MSEQSLENQNFKILIRCITFNHAPYIEDTMNGFTMQKTTFPYVAVIIDDASTDGEVEVIQHYLQEHFDLESPNALREETDDYRLTFARHKTNQNCFFAVYLLKYNFYSIKKSKESMFGRWGSKAPYVSICEGDDYWIDPNKLQKQVIFLETNLDYGMVYTHFYMYHQKSGNCTTINCIQATFEDELCRNRVGTLTTLVRSTILQNYIQEIGDVPRERGWMMGDYPTWIYIMANSKAKLIPEITAVYRVLENSASHYTSFNKSKDFLLSTYDISFFFSDKYNVPQDIRKTIAINEINDLIDLAYKYNTNLHFPLFKFMLNNSIFCIKRYVSAKIVSFVWSRYIYRHLKKV